MSMELLEDGWHSWMYTTPPDKKMIMWTRDGWDSPSVGYRKDVHPEANVNGLYWKLTGIGREE